VTVKCKQQSVVRLEFLQSLLTRDCIALVTWKMEERVLTSKKSLRN